MKALSNKINIPLLIGAVGLLVYFLIDLATILSGRAVLVGPIYPLYISIGVSVLTILVFLSSFIARTLWERKHREEMLGNGEHVR